DDLALASAEGDACESAPAQPVDLELRSAVVVGRVLRRERRLERAADDHREPRGVRALADGGRSAHLAVAETGHAIRDVANLAEAVRDVNDRRALRGAPADGVEEELDRVLGEWGRRLVGGQKARRGAERPR